jgi:hypothetical protein
VRSQGLVQAVLSIHRRRHIGSLWSPMAHRICGARSVIVFQVPAVVSATRTSSRASQVLDVGRVHVDLWAAGQQKGGDPRWNGQWR